MKRRFLAIALICAALFVIVDENRGCGEPPCENTRPVATLSAEPTELEYKAEIEFDGSSSYDPDGDITKYEWDFTNNGSYDYNETSSYYPDGAFDGKTTYQYDSNGTFTCKLRVSDGESCDYDDTDTCTVEIDYKTYLRCNPVSIFPLLDEVMTISYNIVEDANVTIAVYYGFVDVNELPVVTLVNNVSTAAGYHELVWYGMDGEPNDPNSGYVSQEGPYIVEMKLEGVVKEETGMYVYK